MQKYTFPSPSQIHLVVALPLEAKPLIQYFRLKKITQFLRFPFLKTSLFQLSIFQTAICQMKILQKKGVVKEKIRLIVSGMGKASAASSVGFLQALCQEAYPIWLNIGLAGHKSLELGSGHLIHKIVDVSSKRNFYPLFLRDKKTSSYHLSMQTLHTLDRPSTEYVEGALFDMEASGFYETAVKSSTCELVHCYKIISDNEKNPFSLLLQEETKKKVSTWIETNLSTIDAVIASLQKKHLSLVGFIQEVQDIALFFEQRIHFTQTQKHQLKDLLQSYLAIISSEQSSIQATLLQKLERDGVLACLTTKQVLIFLKQKVDEAKLSFANPGF